MTLRDKIIDISSKITPEVWSPVWSECKYEFSNTFANSIETNLCDIISSNGLYSHIASKLNHYDFT